MRVFLNWLIFKQITSTKNKVAYLLLSSPVLETWELNSSFDESPTSSWRLFDVFPVIFKELTPEKNIK